MQRDQVLSVLLQLHMMLAHTMSKSFPNPYKTRLNRLTVAGEQGSPDTWRGRARICYTLLFRRR